MSSSASLGGEGQLWAGDTAPQRDLTDIAAMYQARGCNVFLQETGGLRADEYDDAHTYAGTYVHGADGRMTERHFANSWSHTFVYGADGRVETVNLFDANGTYRGEVTADTYAFMANLGEVATSSFNGPED